MILRLRTKLSLYFILVILISVSLISILSNFFLEKQFRTYTKNNQELKNKELTNSIGLQSLGDGKWDLKGVEDIGISALEQGLVVKLYDTSGKTVWDAAVHNNGLCKQMLDHMANNMNTHYSIWDGKYTETEYPVFKDGERVGKAEIGYYGPFFYNDNDLMFITTLNRLLLIAGILSMLIAILLGSIFAGKISTPIIRAVKATGNISKGHLTDKLGEKSDTLEISQLTSSVNNLAQSLMKQEQLRKRLTGDVAHELRTPMATLQSHMEAMIDGLWNPDKERLKSCHEEIIRINRLVGDLENLTQYESENLVLYRTRYDLSEQIKHILDNFQADFRIKGIEAVFLEGHKEIIADRDKLGQVLVNLFSNALKYTPENGKVEIHYIKTGESLEIVVKDNGKGISQEDLPYIFDRFYRAEKSRNRSTGGAGIGLAIVKAIVDAHKWKISVQSQLGKGSEFKIILPGYGVS